MRKLSGSSEVKMPDGTVLPVRDYDGTLLIDPDTWVECQKTMLARVAKTVTEIVTEHPERREAYGMKPGQTEATLSLLDVLGYKKAPDSAGTPSSAKEK